MGKPLGGNTNKLPYCHFIKLHACACLGTNWVIVHVSVEEKRPSVRSGGWRSDHSQLGTRSDNISCSEFSVTVCFLTLSLSVDLTQGWTEIVFVFSLSKRKTHYRIYEKTHVDLYNHFKPEGMHILSVKLTFLLSLIGVTRGEWRGNLSVVVSCLRKLREKKSLLWLFSL